jgi:hypothetical protein
MKKRSCLILALILVTVQLISAFAVLPVAAASVGDGDIGRTYNIYKSDAAPVLDGLADELWTAYPWSENFVWSWSDASGYKNEKLKANFKAIWTEDSSDATKMNIHLLIEYTGFFNKQNLSGISVFLGDDVNGNSKSDVMRINGSKTGDDVKYTYFNYPYSSRVVIANDGEEDAKVTFEWTCKIPKSAAIKLDVSVIDGDGWSSMMNYTWNGCCGSDGTRQVAKGVCRIMPKLGEIDQSADVLLGSDGVTVASLFKNGDNAVTLPNYEVPTGTFLGWKDAEGKLYPVGGIYTVTGTEQVRLNACVLKESDYTLLTGASMLIKKTSALRFEVQEDAAAMTALGNSVQEKGLLVVETSKLTDAILADSMISAEELDAAEITYEKNVFTTAENGIHYTVKENIADATVSYSASAYIKLKYADNSEKTIFLTYIAQNHARSVKEVSEAAYADRTTVRVEGADVVNYKFKVGSAYAVNDLNLSYSPYTKEQLDLLAELKK